MRKALQHSAFITMRKLSRRCSRHKIDWRRLIFIGATLAISFILFLMLVNSRQLDKDYLSPLESVSLNQSFSNTTLSNEFLEEARHQQVHLSQPASVVSPDVSNRLVQSVPVQLERVEPHQSNISVSGEQEDKAFARKTAIITLSPPHGFVSSRSQRYIRSMLPNEALVYARKEIEYAHQVVEDSDLYSPLFRNVSVFRRSYELMETILKVYIYPDGSRPIFHKPFLKGIYASEGWFMKSMRENKQFVTKNPKKAHLFYLPYSARQLEMALYVPGSHSLKPLSIFLRNYVNKIAAKYPFWNRSHGSDHFLVACHDWGPYTVTEHDELARNTIKALCNADTSEKIFISGRDVSLPETTIRAPRRPLRHVGGNKVSQRPILAFFAGSMHGRVRPKLLKHWGGEKDGDMKIFQRLPQLVSKRMTYIQHMKSSKYCLCPMGYEVNSPRIVEAIYYECVPVIIADNFVLPFSEVLDWNAFSVVVAEKDIPRLKEILLSIPMSKYLTMQTNVKMVQKHFLWNPKPLRYDLFHMILHSIWFNRLNNIQLPRI
ncbi:probable glycosyltransferase At5g25310 isoform X1 [Prosopis cineraria]|uniref:probable glycosyltransferase At5g25310 isoform X1 n=1 Tax=Prosopis cineraria TaxID=364024 RepID=UPI00240F61C2|nr:probable glycosyltransferase At5g25310 isoform X1 [Prosopis cineraria]XP_054809292.1 probable glycosyltransferase At5g25310 isoform X1 [Prosopis cineraria]